MLLLVYSLCSLALGALLLGLSLYPSIWLLAPWASQGPLALSLCLGAGYFLSGLCLLFWCALAHNLCGLRLKPGRYPLISFQSFRWSTASAFYMLIKYTWGDMLMCTPFFVWYLKAVGCKLGKDVMINSKFLHDHGLLEIGEGTLIGGDAVLSAHAAEGGHLLLAPITIGKRCLIGQKAVLMPGVVVGDGAIVAAGAIVLKNTQIPENEIWGGIPAVRLRARGEGKP